MTTAESQDVWLRLKVNGRRYDVVAPVQKTLLEVLREDLGLTGTKHGCELGECGTCGIIVDDLFVLSCLTLPVEVQGKEVRTVEGLARDGKLHPLQQAFSDLGAAQCGYCTPGFLMAAKALLDADPTPNREAIQDGLSGNLCRCTGYLKIFEAVELAADRMGTEKAKGKATIAEVAA